MLTTINLNSVKRYVEEFYAPMQTNNDAFIPAAFRFTNNTDLQGFVNQNSQMCVGNLFVSYNISNVINVYEASLLDLNGNTTFLCKEANLAAAKNFNIDYIFFTAIDVTELTALQPQFYFVGWICTTTNP